MKAVQNIVSYRARPAICIAKKSVCEELRIEASGDGFLLALWSVEKNGVERKIDKGYYIKKPELKKLREAIDTFME